MKYELVLVSNYVIKASLSWNISKTQAKVMKNWPIFGKKIFIGALCTAYYFERLYQIHSALYSFFFLLSKLLSQIYNFVLWFELLKNTCKFWGDLKRQKTPQLQGSDLVERVVRSRYINWYFISTLGIFSELTHWKALYVICFPTACNPVRMAESYTVSFALREI